MVKNNSRPYSTGERKMIKKKERKKRHIHHSSSIASHSVLLFNSAPFLRSQPYLPQGMKQQKKKISKLFKSSRRLPFLFSFFSLLDSSTRNHTNTAFAFLPTLITRKTDDKFRGGSFLLDRRIPALKGTKKPDNNNESKTSAVLGSDALYLERYKRRLEENQRITQQEQQRLQLPNPQWVDPTKFIEVLLSSLQDSHYPYPYFGYQNLLNTSTPQWQQLLLKSVGAPPPPIATAATSASEGDDQHDNDHNNDGINIDKKVNSNDNNNKDTTDEDILWMSASIALGNALERPNNQFGILVGVSEDGGVVSRAKQSYTLTFPTDPIIDEEDDTCWLECRLYSSEQDDNNDELLVVMGWSLCWINNAWHVDNLDWQDFRDKYRPGIGREEWERICG